jgi:hypothetical protein
LESTSGKFGRLRGDRTHVRHVERAARHLREKWQAVVEFVITDRARVVLQQIHDLVDTERGLAIDRRDLRLIVGERGALDRVAVVEQHGIGKFLARRRDQRRRTLQTERLVFRQLVVVVTQQIGMDVGGFQQRKRRGRAIRHLRRGRVDTAAARRDTRGDSHCAQRPRGSPCAKRASRAQPLACHERHSHPYRPPFVVVSCRHIWPALHYKQLQRRKRTVGL